MKSIKELAAKASLVALVATGAMAGTAHALKVTEVSVNSVATDPNITTPTPYKLANELKLSADATVGDDVDDGVIQLKVIPSTGTWPSTATKLNITLTNAGFDGALNGATLVTGCTVAPNTTTPTAVQNSGGADDGSTATFLVTGLDACTTAVGDELVLKIPVDVTAAGDVGVKLGLTTEAGSDIDGGTFSFTAVKSVSGFETTFKADTILSQASLASSFKTLSDGALGTYNTKVDTTAYAGIKAASALLSEADIDTYDVALTGSAVGLNSCTIDPGGGAGTAATVVAFAKDDTKCEVKAINPAAADINADSTIVVADGTGDRDVAISSSLYAATVTTKLVAAFTSEGAAVGDLQAIVREGTVVTFPWVSSAAKAAASGTSNTIRLSNTGGTAVNAVFVEVKNSDVAAFANKGVVNTGKTIPVGGELILTSTDLQGLLGDFGRGDVVVTLEASPSTLTARRLVVRADGVQELSPGNVFQDQN